MSAPKEDPRLVYVSDCADCKLNYDMIECLAEGGEDVDSDDLSVPTGRPSKCPLDRYDLVLRATPRSGGEQS